MKKKIRLVLFYLADELNITDIEKEIFTETQEEFHFFFFHNINLHFSKEKIKNEILKIDFEPIIPEYEHKKDTIIQIKRINDFNQNKFNEKVNGQYDEYLKKINYRIDCMFQTFEVFNQLYKTKNIVYVFPDQLKSHFNNYLNNRKLSYEELITTDELINYFDIMHWIKYFSRLTRDYEDNKELKINNITNIYKISL